jgi:hypothetical protein
MKLGLTLIAGRTHSAEVARKPAINMTMPAVNQMNSMGMDESNMTRLARWSTPPLLLSRGSVGKGSADAACRMVVPPWAGWGLGNNGRDVTAAGPAIWSRLATGARY